jgi:geranylgeranyl diphosphate synthase type I
MIASPLRSFADPMAAALDSELRKHVDSLAGSGDGLQAMVSYAMGWTGAGAGPETVGKRIRPLLCLLSAGAAGGDWQTALSNACAVEFVHSFSLIHDDIQDESLLRRGRPSVWRQYGLAHAINVGDAVFALAFSAVPDLRSGAVLESLRVLSATCRNLTVGQYLDMTYAGMDNIQSAQYQEMIAGKTAALIAASCQLGAVAAEAAPEASGAFREFGHALGMAFQIQDDFLGIWGDPGAIGKPAGADLLLRKKSLPILFGLGRSASFRALLAGDPQPETVPALIAELDACGAKRHTEAQVEEWTARAFSILRDAHSGNEYGRALEELAQSLLGRER